MNPYAYIAKISKLTFTSAQFALQDSFLELLETEDDDGMISVRMVSDRAGVERSVFYSYYDNVKDLHEEIEDDLIYRFLKLDGEKDLKKFLAELINFTDEDSKSLSMLLVKKPGIRFEKKLGDALRYIFFPRLRNGDKDADPLLLDFYALLLIQVMKRHITSPHVIDIDKTVTLLEQSRNVLS